ENEKYFAQRRLALLLLTASELWMQPIFWAAGTFELQIRFARNEKGVLADGRCCRGGLDPPCPVAQQCHAFFRVCLKEYQLRALPGGPCVLGAATTPVLGGNVFSTTHQKKSDHAGRVVIPFDFAWPRSYSLVLEAWDAANASDVTSQGKELLSHLGEPDLWHHGRSTSLEYRVRVRCQEHYYGPACNFLCRPRDDFFGHHSCDAAGNKVCLDGWTGDECKRAICRPGCHETHGTCEEPGECRCHYGWTGQLCDECILFPGCVHGSCTEPWKCDCETNWGGILCDKDLNYCGSHRPCKNGGTCANNEPNEYECLCPDGFYGRNCEEEVTDCLSQPCSHGGTCKDLPDGFKCLCTPQWTGKTCQIGEDFFSSLSPLPPLPLCSQQVKGGRHLCTCREGFTGAECETELSTCGGAPCLHGGQCQETENKTFLCNCPPGLSGSRCEVLRGVWGFCGARSKHQTKTLQFLKRITGQGCRDSAAPISFINLGIVSHEALKAEHDPLCLHRIAEMEGTPRVIQSNPLQCRNLN
uniref:Delta-like protein n=1 Tax=Podarcis muralis TaxID=64176 RepID=A0A670IN67_PODMU